MNTTTHKNSQNCGISQYAPTNQEAELQELENTYAECLGDDVDAKTLTMLWLRIKALKREIALQPKAN